MSEFAPINTKLLAVYKESIPKPLCADSHYHTLYELYYLVDGDVDYLVEGKNYHMEPGSIILFAPHVEHAIQINSTKNYKRFVIQFDASLLDAAYRNQLLFPFSEKSKLSEQTIYYTNVQEYSLYSFCNALIDCIAKKNAFARRLRPIYLEALLAQLSLMCYNSNHSNTNLVSSEMIVKVTDYIHSHLTEKITLKDISEHFYISENHLNRLFRKTVGTTVINYVIQKRIESAQILLKDGVSATEVASKVGFSDYTNFYRAYKKITGHHPKTDIL